MEVSMVFPLQLILSIAIAASTYCHPVDARSGYFSQYSQAPTDGTIDYHQNVSGKLPQDLSGYAGVLAVQDCSLVGADAWIWISDSRANPEYTMTWLPVKVFDCSGHTETTEWMNRNNIIGELGYYLTNDLQVGKHAIKGEILFQNPRATVMKCFVD